MSWYKLDVVRDVLRVEYGAELLPSVIRRRGPHVEVWQRRVGRHVFRTFLNHEQDELLVPEESLLAAAEALRLRPAREFLDRVRTRGGLWLGPDPRP